jgi:hypothetical protein
MLYDRCVSICMKQELYKHIEHHISIGYIKVKLLS